MSLQKIYESLDLTTYILKSFKKIDVNNESILFLSLFFFTIVPSHNCVWVDGAMTRCCDDDGAMTMTRWYEYCAGDGAKTQ